MKQQVIRKILSGSWTSFTFNVKSKSFLVKNFSDNNCFVSYENNDQENESIKIAPMMAEICCITELQLGREDLFLDTIYVKGTGEIEVEAIEYVPN